MFQYAITVEHPAWLAMLAAIPVLWWFSFRSLAGLGLVRRVVALLLRTTVLTALVLALAELRLQRLSERLSVIYLLDQSESIPDIQRRLMVDYVRQEVKNHRDERLKDQAGVIVFGRDAEIEVPPFDDNIAITQVETRVDRSHTNLAAALKMAQAAFPEDAAKRVVVVTDGNENLGDALEQARALTESGIGIDVVPVRYPPRGDVAVEKVVLPPDVRRGQPFELRVVLNNSSVPQGEQTGVVTGKLKIVRKTHESEEVLNEESVKLPPGKSVFTLREQIDEPEFYTYEARFTADAGFQDIDQNNIATSFTHVQGRGRVLLIEDWQTRGEFDVLVKRLRSDNLEVVVQPTNALFQSLAELQPFDCVILGNVARSSGDAGNITGFSDDQVNMLVRNTQQMGAGLIMLGGENSFGAGGWTNTELEAAMPVDFQVKAVKVEAVGALAMIMHASEMADGNHWQKIIAKEALKALGGSDYCGVLHYGAADQWLWLANGMGMIRVGPNRDKMLARLDQMQPGDAPAFDNMMRMADADFAKLTDAAVKHMIIISDGDPSAPTGATLASLTKQGVKVTTVAIAAHGVAESTNLQNIATATGGKYYAVTNAQALPRIFQREARRVARSLVFEKADGFKPNIARPHEMLAGIKGTLPPITGYVLTHKKDSPLVEMAITSPMPAGEADNTILASWTYGLGRAVVFTTDAGHRWANTWTDWENYDKFFTQMVRWAMRPTGDLGKFTVATDVRDGKIRVAVTALDKDDEFLNFLDLSGSIVRPNMETSGLKLQQVAPGRYVGEVDVPASGSYFLSLNPGKGMTLLRAGVNVGYSPEYNDRLPNEPLMKSLSVLAAKDGPAGQLLPPLVGRESLSPILAENTYRRDLPRVAHSADVWHLLLLAGACLFWSDVFMRRVMVQFGWLMVLMTRLRDKVTGRTAAAPKSEYLERLRSRKSAVVSEVEQQRAAMRFEPDADSGAPPPLLGDEPTLGPPPTVRGASPESSLTPDEAADEDYTSRLLRAKRQARKDDEGE